MQRVERRRLRREVARQRRVRGLDNCGVGRLAASLARADRAVHRAGDVAHVDQTFVLEGAGADDGVLRDLVPLLDSVTRRQDRSTRGPYPADERGADQHADHGCGKQGQSQSFVQRSHQGSRSGHARPPLVSVRHVASRPERADDSCQARATLRGARTAANRGCWWFAGARARRIEGG